MILYLHGLNSGGSSHKATLLREALAPLSVLSPSYPAHRADEAVAELSRLVSALAEECGRKSQPLILVGSSMGGFYGRYLAQEFTVDHLVMINPALRPWELLKQVVGWQHNPARNERYYLSPEMVEATRPYGVTEPLRSIPTTLLLDEGDELIDWRIASEICAETAEVHHFPGGNHAFEHMSEAVAIIRRIYQALS
jgi:predicted esterase YcpF (UPF0227 family)